MRQKHNLLLNLKSKKKVLVPVTSLPNVEGRKKAFLRFGNKAVEVDFASCKELASNQILISNDVVEELNIPLSAQYEIIENHTEIIVGPYIGILTCKRQENLHEMVQSQSNYLYDYQDIGGAVIAFAEEGIDMDHQLIEGYVYNPNNKSWDFGSFSYPAAIFRRSGLKKRLRDHFHSVLGDRIFNNYIFSKWEMYNWLSVFPEIQSYLPETIRYQTAADVIWFLQHYSPAYLKPIFGSQGLGIIKASKLENGYTFNFKKDSQDYEVFLETETEVASFLKNHQLDRHYLIQKGINILKNGESLIDFRLILVKDYNKEWRNMGIVARHGVLGSMVSNVSSGGHASMGDEVFRNICKLSEKEIFQLRSKMTKLAITTAEYLEKCGIHCGNLGFDLALDQECNLWIIEINNRDPNHTIAIDAGNRQLFYQIKKMNMLYAKKLAGF